MSDTSITLNPGTGGDLVDAELIGSVKRQRMEICGATLGAVAKVANAPPASTDYALAVRLVPTVSTLVSQNNVVASGASQTLLAANANRKGFLISNDAAGSAGARLYLRLDPTAATATNWSDYVDPGETYAADFNYTGEVRGIFASAAGVARVSEFT